MATNVAVIADSGDAMRARISDLEGSVERLQRELFAHDLVFQQSPVPAIIYDPESLSILRANDKAAALYGYDREGFTGLPWGRLFSPGTFSIPQDGCDDYACELRKPINVIGPALHVRSDERRILVRITVLPMPHEGAEARIAIIQDERPSNETEEALRASEERYRDLFENANDVIFLQDLSGRVVAVNRVTELLTGYSRNELLGQDFAQLLAPQAREQMLDSIRAHLGGSSMQRYELLISPKDGPERYLEISTRMIYQRGQPVAIQGVGRDVTEWKLSQQRLQETAEELRRKNEELSEALKVAREATQLKEQFLANTSHELRTPMNGIMGMTNLLKDTALDADQREYVDAVSQCANDLLTIINDLLDLSQIEAGRFSVNDEPFEIADSVRGVMRLLQIRARAKGLSVSYEIDSRLPHSIYGDSVRFRQILMNLIANGVKFTAEGGVHLSLRKNGPLLHCEVIDSGIGVEESIQERIFEAFYQGDGSLRRRYGGTGLGLTICKQLVEIMGGRIGVHNNSPQPGATFWFDLPLRTAPLETL